MKQFGELIRSRRSTRKFTDKTLTQDEVVELLKAPLMAPSSRGRQSWQFVVVDDRETLARMSECREQGASFVKDAALAVVVMGDPMTADVWVEDAAIAATFIQLQAEDLGFGSCWIQVRERMKDERTSADEYLHELLNLPLPLQTLCIIAIGEKAVVHPPIDEEQLPWEKIHLNKYTTEEV